MKRLLPVAAFLALVFGPRLQAVPPLVSGDVPTAEKGTFEIYPGFEYESDGDSVSRQIPIVELNYGIGDRQELTVEVPYLSLQGQNGFGDMVVGTKYMFVKESKTLPGISTSFELKLNNGSVSRGLGTGKLDYDIRLRAEKTWGWFTVMGNVGYTIIGEPVIDGIKDPRNNVWFASLAQEYKVTRNWNLLGEIYWETSDEPGNPNRFAANVGFEREITRGVTLQAAVGRSLREGQQGGPDLRVYVGFHWVFDAPWKREDK